MKYSAYPKYKDSGVEWIGEIPEGSSFVSVRVFCGSAFGIHHERHEKHESDGWL